ncbi:hypothetical protein CO179_00500 [candidate division WWE3 bacterium CG_4_9_14_3_um_filter_39_7]|uniref:Uncharacterized protein n=1 Tax=candidate division WWE3 bacterium CG_4_9_14_3_um_filter_39_7 TaxID=1975080 RepID=A0A2M7X4Q2_UNCKA|nr:MAG: hypothetical protein CO179_00500 [candidate division WWE3 bacterium CG_4_9_14_3_um_filter_39_7]
MHGFLLDMEQFIGIIIDVLLKLVTPLVRLMKWLYSLLPFEINSKRKKPNLGIIENSYKNHTWNVSKNGEREGISINTDWHITNTLPYNLTALNVRLRKPIKVKGSWMAKDTKSKYWGHYDIPQGYTTDVSFTFWLEDYSIKDDSKELSATIEIIDPIGRVHTLKNVKVKPIGSRKSKDQEQLPTENPAQIESPLEKTVVAVLKDEIEQYKVRGRREGQLGSVEWQRGTIEWHTKGETMKFLNKSSSRTLVQSSNSNALVRLYEKSDENDKNTIVEALTMRLNKETEYSDVGYMIFLTLFELGFLEKGLSTALIKLSNDKKHGFSDTLRLLDLLLAFRYEEFDEEDLDITEKIAFSTEEDTFQIKQRVNAIRIMRIE